jgi:hypothetical protein
METPQNQTDFTPDGFVKPERELTDVTGAGITPEAEKLSDHYNINDQAHRNSSPEDFAKTISNYHHTDGSTTPNDEER